MLAWATLGISLAVHKGQLGAPVDRIGFTITIQSAAARATILAARLDEIRSLADGVSKQNVIGLQDLRSFVGKVFSMGLTAHFGRV